MKKILFVVFVSLLFNACNKEELIIEDTEQVSQANLKISNLERMALEAIYNANPNSILNWDLSDADISNWSGIGTNSEGKIITLSMSDKNIEVIPEEIAGLRHLEKLFLLENKIKSLPKEIGKLTNLTWLDLRGNEVSNLPDQIKDLKKLQYLFLYINNLTHLPSALGELENLEVLSASNNYISSIASSIYKLPKLKELSLHRNKISYLSPEVSQLHKTLTSLSLSYNYLEEIPKEIGKLVNLEYMYLTGNYLTEVPKALNSLTKLRALYLKDNPYLNSLPQEVCNMHNPPQTTLYVDSWSLCY